jgi:hypothetical protein
MLRYIRLRLAFLSFCYKSLRLFSFPLLYKHKVSLSFITICYVHDTFRHIPTFPQFAFTPRQTSNLVNVHISPSTLLSFESSPHPQQPACGASINTDEVLFPFIVICVPKMNNISNLLPLFERSCTFPYHMHLQQHSTLCFSSNTNNV